MSTTNDDKPVGYKSPPHSTRFKPGQSGNPSGRPKKVNSLKVELINELAEFTNVTEDGRKLEVTKSRAIAKAIVRAATSGNMRAIAALVTLFARDQLDLEQSEAPSPAEQALIDDFVDREVRRRANTSNDPKPLAEKE